MNDELSITPAKADERAEALDLIFQHLPSAEQRQRRANGLALIESGDIPASSLLIARRAERLCGAIVCIPMKGASALFWLPQAIRSVDANVVLDRLVRHCLNTLQPGGAKIAQAIIAPADLPHAAPLIRCGFRHITRVQFLRQARAFHGRTPPGELSFETYQPGNERLFHETLERTYIGTLDIPELNGRRSIEEIIEGHKNQGRFRPELWHLARLGQRPVGVLMLADLDAQGFEIAYLGVVPEERGHGLGWALSQYGVERASAAGIAQLMVAVDVRNDPARQLYEKMGFVPHDEREVLLFFFMDLARDDVALHGTLTKQLAESQDVASPSR